MTRNQQKEPDDPVHPLREQQSAFKRTQATRSMRQARFLFHCSLVLVAAIAFLIASDLLSGRARAPGAGVLVVVGIAVAITWQRYRKASQAVKQGDGPA